MTTDMDQLLRYLEGSLAPDEHDALAHRLDADIHLRERLERLRLVRADLRRTGDTTSGPGFGFGFSQRVMRRVFEHDAAPLRTYESLQWAFTRTALAGATLVVLLGVVNIASFGDTEMFTGWVDAMFAMPSDSLVDALAYTSADLFFD